MLGVEGGSTLLDGWEEGGFAMLSPRFLGNCQWVPSLWRDFC